MRKLQQIEVDFARNELWALDENGELWHGTADTSEDGRRVVDWTPVQLPPDGMAFSEPQRSFWDKVERDAKRNIETKITLDSSGEAAAVAQEEPADASGTREEGRRASGTD